MGGVAYTAKSDPLRVDPICPPSLSKSSPNVINLTFINQTTTTQTVKRMAIGYIGSTPTLGRTLNIAGPFQHRFSTPLSVPPFPGSITVNVAFPAVPSEFSVGTVITTFAEVF